VLALVEDESGSLFVGTGRGLDRLDPVTRRVSTEMAGHGLPFGENFAALRDRTGALWFSYSTGLVRLLPAARRRETSMPVSITAIRSELGVQPLSPLGERTPAPFVLALGHRSVEFDFASVGSGPGDAVRYETRLEGGSGTWSEPSTARSISYANLAPGEYRFSVRALEHIGSRAGSESSVPFSVPAPLWRRWWA
jgi:hypothetical protein